MQERERQTVAVALTLSGIQNTAVVGHHAGTESAAVSVRIGSALIYLHDAPTASAFVRAWQRHTYEAPRLPRESSRKDVAPVAGMKEPAVVIDAHGSPAAVSRLVRPVGQDSYLRIKIGRVVFNVRDIGAFASTIVALRDAESLSRSVFRAPGVVSRRQQAFENVAQALPSPRPVAAPGGQRRPREGRAADPSRAAPSRAPRPGARWMQ